MATSIFGSDEYKALKGGGRGMTAQISQIQAAIQQRPDLFTGGRKNVSKTELAKGYSLTGGAGKVLADTITYRGNETYSGGTFNVYKDAPAAAPEPAVEEPVDTPIATTLPVTDPTPTNPYQGQIDSLTATLDTISGQMGGYTDTINRLNKQMETMQTNFGKQLETIMASNTKAMEEMSNQYQEQMRQQQAAQEAARQQRELAAQTAAANQARAGQQAEFSLGSGMMRGIFGGLAGFKRRGKIKAQASGALAIAATEGQTKSPNKMLNV